MGMLRSKKTVARSKEPDPSQRTRKSSSTRNTGHATDQTKKAKKPNTATRSTPKKIPKTFVAA
jgi:hypothetical protein